MENNRKLYILVAINIQDVPKTDNAFVNLTFSSINFVVTFTHFNTAATNVQVFNFRVIMFIS